MLWPTRKRRNQDTAANPMTNAMTVATRSCGPVALIPSPTRWKASGSENSPQAPPPAARPPRGQGRQPVGGPDGGAAPPRELFDVAGSPSEVLGRGDHR